ncbi:MAG: glycoside hydrolase family 18 protein [Acidobacteriaceae bacterium]
MRGSLSVLALGSLTAAGAVRAERTRRILYVLGQFSQATPPAMQAVVETIGGSGFNVAILSFLQASSAGGKLTLLYNGNEFSSLAPEVPALLARLRSGFSLRRRVMLSVGGWQETATFAAIRSFGAGNFVRQLSERVIRPLGFDGIDLDLEPQTGGLDHWMETHREYGRVLAEITNEYKRVHPEHVVTHAPLSMVAAEMYAKATPLPGLPQGMLAATCADGKNNIDWLNVQFYEGGLMAHGDIAGFYCDSLAAPLTKMRERTGVARPLHFFTPLFQPEAKQPLVFCQQTMRAIDGRCAGLHAGRLDGVALWDYRQVASSINTWATGLAAALPAQ